jgi:hypothetical protein
VAKPPLDPLSDDVAEQLTLLAYVYLLRTLDGVEPEVAPKAKIPTVELPAAAPRLELGLEFVPAVTTQPE